MAQFNISSRAMLVSQHITKWTCFKQDKAVTEKVRVDHDATTDAGSYNKRLLAKDALERVNQIAGEARNTHYELTLPWLANGQALLPSAMFTRYDDTMRRLKGEWDIALRDFYLDYPRHVDDARARLGRLFKPGDYPDLAVVQKRFSWEIVYSPVPTGNDFRVKLSDDATAHIKADIERRTRTQIEESMSALFHRVSKVVQHMATSLEEYTVVMEEGRAKVKNPFRDSLVANVREMADLLPLLNVTGDKTLTDIHKRMMDTLSKHEPDALRADATLRKDVATEARAILDDMAGFLGGE